MRRRGKENPLAQIVTIETNMKASGLRFTEENVRPVNEAKMAGWASMMR